MKSKKEIESLVKENIDNLGFNMTAEEFRLTKMPGEEYPRIKKNVVIGSMDLLTRKQSLLDNFEETVRLTIIRDIGRILTILKSVRDIEKIPGIDSTGLGKYCKLTIEDIRDLKLDDPKFVAANFYEILQSIYESYGYEEHLPTPEEVDEVKRETAKAIIAGEDRVVTLEMEKKHRLMTIARGAGNFLVNGLPCELSGECIEHIEERKANIMRRQGKSWTSDTQDKKDSGTRTKTGEALGRESQVQQENTNAKEEAKKRLEALRAKINQQQSTQK